MRQIAASMHSHVLLWAVLTIPIFAQALLKLLDLAAQNMGPDAMGLLLVAAYLGAFTLVTPLAIVAGAILAFKKPAFIVRATAVILALVNAAILAYMAMTGLLYDIVQLIVMIV